ncbi:Isocitrate dehydrogenase [NADP] [Commensalibacter sp. Nvir]|uniref:isocitrate/isopropylmalate dehydrogenase family protein n=1 Tax=Commensalibacter sp. Nvir TaxID=3069817 RepID=UPI002D4BFE35|nr:Isocitrate dehydrogenase [NADP] [Commensalibacter sp. Nvir]
MNTTSSLIPVTLIPGDGIGPEIMAATLKILETIHAPFQWDKQLAGMAGVECSNNPLPAQTLESIHKTGLVLKGPLTTPIGKGYRSVNVTLRKEFQLYANVRPVKMLIPGGRFENVDIVLVRENLEGFYAAMENIFPVEQDTKAIATCTGYTSRTECHRIVKYAFDYAVANNRKKVTLVHKANILKELCGLFLEEGRKVAKEYQDKIYYEERIVDVCAMELVLIPETYDVIVTTNLFGDILSDLASGLIGGLGLAPGINIGNKTVMFEAVHGSAPDIAGKNCANPLAILKASALMLQYVNRDDLSDRINKAIHQVVIKNNIRTRDLGGNTSTSELTEALIQAVQ